MKIKEDLTGQKIGEWQVISCHNPPVNTHGEVVWDCICPICKTIVQKTYYDLKTRKAKSCINCRGKMLTNDITGKRFGRWTVIEKSGTSKNGTLWHCKCDCGKEKNILRTSLINGKSKSCGCYNQEVLNTHEDLTGRIFGYLHVISDTNKRGENGTIWNVKCTNCNRILEMNRSSLMRGSISCGCIKSKAEVTITKMLNDLGLSFEPQYQFEDLKTPKGNYLRFDWCVFENNRPLYLIEYQGQQHFQSVEYFGGEEKYQTGVEYDNIKKQYCKEHNIPLIEILYNEEITPEKLLMFKTKGVEDESFIQYKKPSMFISNTRCNGFKCDKENGTCLCINRGLSLEQNKMISVDKLIQRYLNNKITNSIVFGGLENFDEFEQMFNFIRCFRCYSEDDIVIYTGYNQEEIGDKINMLKQYPNIIIKYGRFKPNEEPHYDSVLGVRLASANQRAERIS